MQYRVLVADDKSDSVEVIRTFLERNGFLVETAENGTKAIGKVRSFGLAIAVVILDYRMADRNGAETAATIREIHPDAYVLIHSGDDSRSAIQCSWEKGAHLFIEKTTDPKEFLSKVQFYYRKYEEENRLIFQGADGKQNISQISSIGLIGRSAVMAEIAKKVARYAGKSETVLILGESGVGKERVAKALH